MGVNPPPPPPRGGGVGHLSVCGYAKILGGWVPELTPPPLGGLSKTLTLTIAIAPAAMLPAMCVEVNRLGYVHARRQSPSSLLVGTRDAPIRPLSCFTGHRDTPVPP